MFVIKILIGVVFVVIGVKFGSYKANLYKEEFYFWKSISFLSQKILSELEFKKTNLQKVLKRDYQSSDFTFLIDNYLKNYKIVYPDYVKAEEKVYVEEFFNALMHNDTLSLKNSLQSLNSEFLRISNEKGKTYQKYYSLAIKLGFFAGFSLLIMVI